MMQQSCSSGKWGTSVSSAVAITEAQRSKAHQQQQQLQLQRHCHHNIGKAKSHCWSLVLEWDAADDDGNK